jgi:serine O-acetyltransferase
MVATSIYPFFTERTKVSIVSHLSEMAQAIRVDFQAIQRYRAKYHHDQIADSRIVSDFVTKIGFQMVATVRMMQAVDAAKIPLAPQVVSRMIRHLYGAEVHWKAKIAPGVTFVHGNGLVISKDATIGPGCILFHNVTLGQGIDPNTRKVGGPTLGADVHVGPGATLIGPIHIGDGTKIAAGAVVMQSVPARSLVASPPVVIQSRERTGTTDADSAT